MNHSRGGEKFYLFAVRRKREELLERDARSNFAELSLSRLRDFLSFFSSRTLTLSLYPVHFQRFGSFSSVFALSLFFTFSPFFLLHRRKMISFGNWARWTAVKWPAGSSFIPGPKRHLRPRPRSRNLSPPPVASVEHRAELLASLVYPAILVALATISARERAT